MCINNVRIRERSGSMRAGPGSYSPCVRPQAWFQRSGMPTGATRNIYLVNPSSTAQLSRVAPRVTTSDLFTLSGPEDRPVGRTSKCATTLSPRRHQNLSLWAIRPAVPMSKFARHHQYDGPRRAPGDAQPPPGACGQCVGRPHTLGVPGQEPSMLSHEIHPVCERHTV